MDLAPCLFRWPRGAGRALPIPEEVFTYDFFIETLTPRQKGKKVAPGPNGCPSFVFLKAPEEVKRFAYEVGLKMVRLEWPFPEDWVMSKMCIMDKPGDMQMLHRKRMITMVDWLFKGCSAAIWPCLPENHPAQAGFKQTQAGSGVLDSEFSELTPPCWQPTVLQ